MPQRVDVRTPSDWRNALEVLLREGAVVLRGLAGAAGEQPEEEGGSLRQLAADLPARLLHAANGASGGAAGAALRLLSPDAPVNGVHDELRETKKRGLYLPGSGLEPHTDGYVYGDDLPDYVFLVCEQPSLLGGANVLLDGVALLKALEEGSVEERELAAWLREAPVDLSEPAEAGIVAGRAAQGPIVQWHATPGGDLRLKWRRQINVGQTQQLSTWSPLTAASSEDAAAVRCAQLSNISYLSLWRPLPSTDPGAAAETELKLRAFDAVIQRATATAFSAHSFMLSKGEALVVDNYRVLHGRAPYQPAEQAQSGLHGGGEADLERRFWRVWSWTSAGTGLPPDGARTSNPVNDEVFQPGRGGPPKAEL